MSRIVAFLLVLIAVFPAGATAAEEVNCQDVAAYFTRVDEDISDGMMALIKTPGFRESFERANEKSETEGTGFLALSSGEQDAVIAFLTVPGEALERIGDEEIPDAVRDLHDSATVYWVKTPQMMRDVAVGGPSAAMSVARKLDSAAEDNELASQNLMKACPELVESYAGQAERMNADNLIAIVEDADSAPVEGIGYTVLFFAAGEDDTGGTPAARAWGIDLATA